MEDVVITDSRGRHAVLLPIRPVRDLPPETRERYRQIVRVREQFTGSCPPAWVRTVSAVVLASAFGMVTVRTAWNVLSSADADRSAMVLGLITSALGGYIGWNLVMQFPWQVRPMSQKDMYALIDSSRFCMACGYDCQSVRADRWGIVDCPECGASWQFVGLMRPVTWREFPNTWARPMIAGRERIIEYHRDYESAEEFG